MAMEKIRPANIGDTAFCPGCGHGVFLRLMHELLIEKGLYEKNICCVGVGCSATTHGFVRGDNKVECHHGRAAVTARAMKLMLPEVCLWTYQGDGDAYSIGMGETVLAALGDYPISMFILNNLNYGMTGGQMSSTTLTGQVTTTSPEGKAGEALDGIKMLCTIDKLSYVARGTTATAAEIKKLKKYMSRAIDVQMEEKRFACVEILTPCPTNWRKTPVDACRWIMDEAVKKFPLGEFKK